MSLNVGDVDEIIEWLYPENSFIGSTTFGLIVFHCLHGLIYLSEDTIGVRDDLKVGRVEVLKYKLASRVSFPVLKNIETTSTASSTISYLVFNRRKKSL